LAEVQFGNLALDKSEDEQVREFAKRMVQDHSAANQQLLAAAGKTPPMDLDPEHQAMYLHLSGLSGEEFDHEYMRGQVQDHQTAVELFATEADQPTSSVDQLAGELLPKLRQHLEMAQEISASMV
jgi:putative membrane protein